MKISVIIPCYNAERHILDTVESLVHQSVEPHELELLVIDGASTDQTLALLQPYADRLTHLVSEPDTGPASALNKGFRLATGEVVCWLNADDVSGAGSLQRVLDFFTQNPDTAIAFGKCPIMDEQGREIRKGITLFKQLFFPLSSRFTLQCINYISQPASFYRAEDAQACLPLREDLKAAFDYDFHLRLVRRGRLRCIPGPALSSFRWHPGSISGSSFRQQFLEEWELARADAGTVSVQNVLHWFVRWGIVSIYSLMVRRAS